MRTPAMLPEAYLLKSGKILFPMDGKAGGTWIALHNNGNAMVLLNGAFQKHTPEPPYRKSRGIIFLDIFDNESPKTAFEDIELDKIEPFTLVILEAGKLFEARWDGYKKCILPMPAYAPAIWSSVTLYDNEVIELRKKWFQRWLTEPQYKSAESIRQFHEFGGNGDESISFKMNRAGILQTISITGIEITPGKAVMHYKDFPGRLVSVHEWFMSGLFQKSVAGNSED